MKPLRVSTRQMVEIDGAVVSCLVRCQVDGLWPGIEPGLGQVLAHGD